MAKDTYYYVFCLLWVLVMLDVYVSEFRRPLWWQWILLCISPLMCCLVRPNGVGLVLLTALGGILFSRKQWKIYVICLLLSVLPTLAINWMGENYWGIGKVPTRESLSIPLQQTARYLQYHYDDLTQEETEVLNTVFSVDVSLVPYMPESSDGVKASFREDATEDEVKAYLQVWLGQFFKHPKTYIQALLNHTYGYFYPNRAWTDGYYGTYYLGNSSHWSDGIIDLKFAVGHEGFRDFYRNMEDFVARMPLIACYIAVVCKIIF
ncbi:MAG: DUF6020 family protein [Lachnoclostridium sp.]|nr:DUF6020 family protein [Lachnospira sp.]MCM1248946.1 DUF6020 family protein [Lachnoclostridium sp.]MCM1535158.1 DUF6020 family protein [Clostridium sp.]